MTRAHRGTVTAVASMIAAIALTGCGSDEPAELPQQGVAPAAAEDPGPPQPGKIVGSSIQVKYGKSPAGFGSDSSTKLAGDAITCWNDRVEINDPKANDGPVVLTVHRTGPTTLTQEHEQTGPQTASLENAGQWKGNIVQIDAQSETVSWSRGDGDMSSAIQITGAVQCGVTPAPTTTTGY